MGILCLHMVVLHHGSSSNLGSMDSHDRASFLRRYLLGQLP